MRRVCVCAPIFHLCSYFKVFQFATSECSLSSSWVKEINQYQSVAGEHYSSCSMTTCQLCVCFQWMESRAHRMKTATVFSQNCQIFLPSVLRRHIRGQRYTGSLENHVLFQPANGACNFPWEFWLASLLRNQDIWKRIVSDYSFIACVAHWHLGSQWVCTFYSSWIILFN